MKKLYRFKTRVGYFYIVDSNGRFCIFFEDERLDCYSTIQQALDDLVGGHGWSNSSGVDSSTLDISDSLSDWERLFQ